MRARDAADALSSAISRARTPLAPLPGWCRPIMTLGYQRPLYAEDLWKIDRASYPHYSLPNHSSSTTADGRRARPTASREAALLSRNLDASWARRVAECETYNARLASGELPVPFSIRLRWLATPGSSAKKEEAWRAGAGKRQPQLIFAIVEQFRLFYYASIAFKIGGDTCQMFSPIRSWMSLLNILFFACSLLIDCPPCHPPQSLGESPSPPSLRPTMSDHLYPSQVHHLLCAGHRPGPAEWRAAAESRQGRRHGDRHVALERRLVWPHPSGSVNFNAITARTLRATDFSGCDRQSGGAA